MSGVFRSLTLAGLCFGLCQSAFAQNTDHSDLITIGRAWGLMKYTHPEVTRCAVDWDQALKDSLNLSETSTSADSLNQSLQLLLQRAGGQNTTAAATSDTPSWLLDSRINAEIREQLIALTQRHVEQQCYVAEGNVGQADFSSEPFLGGPVTGTENRYTRALAAFRFWNAVEYFFPYRDQIGDDWENVLAQHLPDILNAEEISQYIFAMRRFTAATEDGHTHFSQLQFFQFVGTLPPPFSVRSIQGELIVDDTLAQARGVERGDAVIAVDGVSVADLRTRFESLAHGSNPIGSEYILNSYILNGAGVAERTYRFRRIDGSEYESVLPLNFIFGQELSPNDQAPWQVVTPPAQSCQYGVVDLDRLESSQVGQMLNDLRETDGIIFDVRNYPNFVIPNLADMLYGESREVAAFTEPDFNAPGNFTTNVVSFPAQRHVDYSGRLIVLMDERSISRSEYTVMGLQAYGNTITIGSQTAGADGDITEIRLPGGIDVNFSGLGVFYPDGTPTQRFGIVPDLHQFPTRAGIAAGRDELMETALNCDWLSETPAPRQAEPGIYWNPERNGEGIEIYQVGEQTAVVQFAFDDNGNSEWLLGASNADQSAWQADLNRFQRNEQGLAATVSAGQGSFDFHRGPYNPLCATVDQSNIANLGSFSWNLNGEQGESCLRPLFDSVDSTGFSGAWNAGDTENGWGLSLYELANNRIAVALYIYDTNGDPRWLLGTADRGTGNAISVEMMRFQGYCRSCSPEAVSNSSAGTVTLNLTSPSQDFAAGNRISIDIDSAQSPTIVWQRSDLPIRLLSAPR